ncbi:PH domain-containing protein [Flavobacterium sp. CBA20B-1]|uniref:PH domain-containing protein n=1 Tax=unclassified Flavobacterium TaxID=196869 RepID=UPI002224767F|nr:MULTISPECIES: PH domain-containing protein [unclassified Flavobacterium]WCM42736.1 PH domain-containing protein [Flavobacterium sp. CBA20B-1]
MSQKTNYNFSQPNKLDRKALFLVLATSLWTVVRASWPILAIMFVRKGEKSWYLLAGIAVITFFTFLRKLVDFFYFSYEVVHNELIIKKGWLSKSTTVVSLDKIHEVNLNQKFVHKLVGLYLISIDTAGSSKTEIEINGVDYKKALAFKEVITNYESTEVLTTHSFDTDESPEEETKKQANTISNTINIGLPSLIKIGLTRNYFQTLGLMIAISFQIIDQLQDLFYLDDNSTVYDDIFDASYEQYIGFVGLLMILALIVLIVLFNLGRTLLTYYNYQINFKKQNITASYGLTDSHIVSVKSSKVQMFLFQQNYFQRLMNLFEVKIKQVASTEDNKNKKGLIVPGANYLELNALFQVIFSKNLIDNQHYFKPNKRVLLLKMLWLCLPVFIAMGVLYATDSLYYSWVVVLAFFAIYLLMYLGYKNEKLMYQDDFIVLKKGVWDIATINLPIYKIQKVSISQSYFQEKNQIGSLILHTAGGTVTLFYYDFTLLQQMANEILYKIEKNKHSWM